jgi:hypothetical protein
MKLLERKHCLHGTILSFCFVFLLASCGKNNCREDEGSVALEKELSIIRLEDEIDALTDTAAAKVFLNTYPLFSEKFLQRSKLPHDSILTKDIYGLSTSEHVDTMRNDVKREFPNLNWLKTDLSNLFSHIKHYYPDFYVPPVYTLVSGYGVDLEIKDSIVVIGLEFFLSDSSRYMARSADGNPLPSYIRRRLKKRFLVPEIAMVEADRFCEIDPLDNTMMGEMMKWGRVYYFMERTMPCLQDSLLTGYTEKELEDVNGNLSTIWAHYLDKNLFFNTDLFLIKKYCDERPKIIEIGENCPGRIGRWLGWQIVRKWAKDKKLSLNQVMAEKDARKIFTESGFKP